MKFTMVLKLLTVLLWQVRVDLYISYCLYNPLLAAVYGARYISDRYLPDKAIDLVDEAASALRLAQESKPDELEALEREIMTLQIELESLKNEVDVFSVERKTIVEEELRVKKEEAQELTAIWQNGAIHFSI
jgi:ATP-dependent Clp protease ATP-binding subunit ClpB